MSHTSSTEESGSYTQIKSKELEKVLDFHDIAITGSRSQKVINAREV